MSASTGPSWVRLACVLVLVASGLAPSAGAHNPADAIYHPVGVEDRWLVTGGEGTWAFLDPDGTPILRGNLSGEGEILQAPVAAGDQAATLVRQYPSLEPEVQAFDRTGPTWNVTVGEPEQAGYVVSDGDGFTVFLRDGSFLEVSADGAITEDTQLDVEPRAEPVPAGEGWWVAGPDGLALVQDGQVVEEASFAGRPTDLTTSADHVLVSLSHSQRSQATLMAFTPGLELDFSRATSGLRLGGSPATTGQAYVVGTYDPDGARALALDATNGTLLWERSLGNATAAAPASVDGKLVFATTEGLEALSPAGERLWNVSAQPYLESPVTTGELITPTGRANRLVAVHPNGSLAWTWTDGVDLPSWTAHHAETTSGEEDSTGTSWLGVDLDYWLGAAALVAVAAAIVLEFREREP